MFAIGEFKKKERERALLIYENFLKAQLVNYRVNENCVSFTKLPVLSKPQFLSLCNEQIRQDKP